LCLDCWCHSVTVRNLLSIHAGVCGRDLCVSGRDLLGLGVSGRDLLLNRHIRHLGGSWLACDGHRCGLPRDGHCGWLTVNGHYGLLAGAACHDMAWLGWNGHRDLWLANGTMDRYKSRRCDSGRRCW